MAIRVLVNVECVNTADPASHIWWDAAVEAADSAPRALARLLRGAEVIEVSESEAEEIRGWAAKLPGWADRSDNEKPLLFQVAGEARFVRAE